MLDSGNETGMESCRALVMVSQKEKERRRERIKNKIKGKSPSFQLSLPPKDFWEGTIFWILHKKLDNNLIKFARNFFFSEAGGTHFQGPSFHVSLI